MHDNFTTRFWINIKSIFFKQYINIFNRLIYYFPKFRKRSNIIVSTSRSLNYLRRNHQWSMRAVVECFVNRDNFIITSLKISTSTQWEQIVVQTESCIKSRNKKYWHCNLFSNIRSETQWTGRYKSYTRNSRTKLKKVCWKTKIKCT